MEVPHPVVVEERWGKARREDRETAVIMSLEVAVVVVSVLSFLLTLKEIKLSKRLVSIVECDKYRAFIPSRFLFQLLRQMVE